MELSEANLIKLSKDRSEVLSIKPTMILAKECDLSKAKRIYSGASFFDKDDRFIAADGYVDEIGVF